MLQIQSTEYYLIKDSQPINVATLLPEEAVEDVLDELKELAEPSPGDENYAHVYGKAIYKKGFGAFIESRLKDTFTRLSEDTGQDPVVIYQWNSPDSRHYFLLKGRNMVELEDLLGPTDPDEYRDILHELHVIFEGLESTVSPAYVRAITFDRDDLNEDKRRSEALRDMVGKELPDSAAHSVSVYQWTE